MKTMKGYHITSTANIGEIAKHGLVPKIANNSMESEYYKRVYFGTEKNNLFVGLLKNRLKYFNKEEAFKMIKDFFVQDSVLLELNLSDENVYIHENMDPKNSHTKPMIGIDKNNIDIVTIDDSANIKSYFEYMAETIYDLPKEFHEFIEYLNQESNLETSFKNNILKTKNIQQYYSENEQDIEYKSFDLYKNNLFKLLKNDDIDVPLYLMAIIDSNKHIKYNDENIKHALSIISEKLKNNVENNSNLYKLVCKISDDCLVNEKEYGPMTREYINSISRFCVNADKVEKSGKVDNKCIMGCKIQYLNFEKDKLKELCNIPTTDEKELYNILEDNYQYIIDVRGKNFNLENENLLEKIKDKDLESIFINSYGFGKSLNSILEFPYYKNQSNKYMYKNVEEIYKNIHKDIANSNIGLDNNKNFMNLLSKINEVCLVEKNFYTPELSECIERVLKSQVYININKNSKNEKMENNDYYSLDALLEYKNHFDNEVIELAKTDHDKEIIPLINKNFEQIYNMREYLSGGSLENSKNEEKTFRESMKSLINNTSEGYMQNNNTDKNILKEDKTI